MPQSGLHSQFDMAGVGVRSVDQTHPQTERWVEAYHVVPAHVPCLCPGQAVQGEVLVPGVGVREAGDQHGPGQAHHGRHLVLIGEAINCGWRSLACGAELASPEAVGEGQGRRPPWQYLGGTLGVIWLW